MSLVEVMVVVGVMGVMMLVMMTMQTNQMKSTNYLEFQLKRTQLQGTLIGQVLKNPNNCACLFSGATAFPVAGIATLTGAAPSQIGLYTTLAPGCGAPTQFFVDGTGIDGLKATSIQLQNIAPTIDPNVYSGSFDINIQSTKEVLGPKDLPIRIPVSISTSPAGANVNFNSCSTAGIATLASLVYMRCPWTQPNGFGTCIPPACPGAFTDTGLIFSEVSSANAPWNQGSTVRTCYIGNGNQFEAKCPWNAPNTFGSCTPPACPAGFIDLGLTKEVTGSSNVWNVGNDIRYCKN